MIQIHFDFKDRQAEDIAQLNAILASMHLLDLQLKDPRGYLSTTTDGDGNLISYRYGLDSGILVCTRTMGSSGLQYEIDSAVTDLCVKHEDFIQIWRNAHPDRALRTVIRSEFDDVAGYLLIHHQRD